MLRKQPEDSFNAVKSNTYRWNAGDHLRLTISELRDRKTSRSLNLAITKLRDRSERDSRKHSEGGYSLGVHAGGELVVYFDGAW